MNLIQHHYTCGNCKHLFPIPGISDFAYGQFVLVSGSGKEFAYLNAFSDEVFSEIGRMVDAHQISSKKTDQQRADAIQEFFGQTCDPSPDGTGYRIGGMPACPACNSRQMAQWEVDATKNVCVVPNVSHLRWNGLSKQKCKELLHNFLAKFPW